MSTGSLLGRIDRTGVPLLLARLAIGIVFILMGWAKVQDPINFLKLMRQYRMMDEQTWYVFLNASAVIVPWLEIVCGVVLLAGVAVRPAGIISAGMLLAFTPLILKRGLELYQADPSVGLCGVNFDCGCGAGQVYLCSKIAENVGLFLAALIVVFSRSRRFCLSNRWARRESVPVPAGAGA